jgi:hypothetical protein
MLKVTAEQIGHEKLPAQPLAERSAGSAFEAGAGLGQNRISADTMLNVACHFQYQTPLLKRFPWLGAWYYAPVVDGHADRPPWRPAPLQHLAEHEHLTIPISGQVQKDSPDNSD